jgi:hypothetical protein
MIQNKHSTIADPVSWVLALAGLALFVLSIRFATERVIFTDTAVYMFAMADSGHPYIATNRFVCLLSQVLPLAGAAVGLSLKTIVCLYSINCILIPLVSCFVCLRLFRNKEAALATLLFYVLMSNWVFYYPVSEFQMGLCLLIVYHAFVLWYWEREIKKPWLFAVVSLLTVTTVIFSHPLTLYVYVAWTVWLLVRHAVSRKWWMLLPSFMAIVAHLVKEQFFSAAVGALNYEEQKKEGLAYFKAPLSSYFDSLLAKGALKSLTDDYFVLLLLVLLSLFFFLSRKQWLNALLFAGTIFGFWLLVTVSFKDWRYDHYPEHLYQPVPFFVALAFASVAPNLFRNTVLRTACLLAVFAVSLGKIYGNHGFFAGRLDWYRQYIQLMHRSGIRHATLSEEHKVYGGQYSYWASSSESLLLSGLPGPDSAVQILVNGNAAALNERLKNEAVVPSRYFGTITEPFVSLDSLYSAPFLDSLAKISLKY